MPEVPKAIHYTSDHIALECVFLHTLSFLPLLYVTDGLYAKLLKSLGVTLAPRRKYHGGRD